MSPKSPMETWMVWLGGVFGSSWSGVHLPDGGTGESAARFPRTNLQHHMGPSLLL
jgi:hypothetical protein